MHSVGQETDCQSTFPNPQHPASAVCSAASASGGAAQLERSGKGTSVTRSG